MKDSLIYLIVSAVLSCVGIILTVLFWQADLLFIPIIATGVLVAGAATWRLKKKGITSDYMWDYLFTLFGTVGGSILALLIWFIFIA